MIDPLIEGLRLHQQPLVEHAVFDADDDLCAGVLVAAGEENLEFLEILRKSLLHTAAVFLIVLIDPLFLIQREISVVDHADGEPLRVYHPTALEKLIDQRRVGIQHVVVGFENVFGIMTADALVAPPPEVERAGQILRRAGTDALAQDVEIAVLMDRQ